MTKETISTVSKKAVTQQTVFRWLVMGAVFTLAGFRLWNWAWLVLGAFTFSSIADTGLAITLALIGLWNGVERQKSSWTDALPDWLEKR